MTDNTIYIGVNRGTLSINTIQIDMFRKNKIILILYHPQSHHTEEDKIITKNDFLECLEKKDLIFIDLCYCYDDDVPYIHYEDSSNKNIWTVKMDGVFENKYVKNKMIININNSLIYRKKPDDLSQLHDVEYIGFVNYDEFNKYNITLPKLILSYGCKICYIKNNEELIDFCNIS